MKDIVQDKPVVTVSRLEVMDHTWDGSGRAYHKWTEHDFDVRFDIQDDGRTLKIFLSSPLTEESGDERK